VAPEEIRTLHGIQTLGHLGCFPPQFDAVRDKCDGSDMKDNKVFMSITRVAQLVAHEISNFYNGTQGKDSKPYHYSI
jgi:hypothetical protein